MEHWMHGWKEKSKWSDGRIMGEDMRAMERHEGRYWKDRNELKEGGNKME